MTTAHAAGTLDVVKVLAGVLGDGDRGLSDVHAVLDALTGAGYRVLPPGEEIVEWMPFNGDEPYPWAHPTTSREAACTMLGYMAAHKYQAPNLRWRIRISWADGAYYIGGWQPAEGSKAGSGVL